LTFNASLGLGKTRFDETGYANFNQITDRRGSDQNTILAATGQLPARGNFSSIGRGFVEPTVSKTKRLELNLGKTASFWGQHTFGIGYTFQRGNYDGLRDRSGPHWTNSRRKRYRNRPDNKRPMAFALSSVERYQLTVVPSPVGGRHNSLGTC
jgi:hypothetical protein